MGRSLKKGPFVSQKLLAKIDAQLESGDRKPDQDLEPCIHDYA